MLFIGISFGLQRTCELKCNICAGGKCFEYLLLPSSCSSAIHWCRPAPLREFVELPTLSRDIYSRWRRAKRYEPALFFSFQKRSVIILHLYTCLAEVRLLAVNEAIFRKELRDASFSRRHSLVHSRPRKPKRVVLPRSRFLPANLRYVLLRYRPYSNWAPRAPECPPFLD